MYVCVVALSSPAHQCLVIVNFDELAPHHSAIRLDDRKFFPDSICTALAAHYFSNCPNPDRINLANSRKHNAISSFCFSVICFFASPFHTRCVICSQCSVKGLPAASKAKSSFAGQNIDAARTRRKNVIMSIPTQARLRQATNKFVIIPIFKSPTAVLVSFFYLIAVHFRCL